MEFHLRQLWINRYETYVPKKECSILIYDQMIAVRCVARFRFHFKIVIIGMKTFGLSNFVCMGQTHTFIIKKKFALITINV